MRHQIMSYITPGVQQDRLRIYEERTNRSVLRGVVYARYSTLGQNAISIERQIANARAWATSNHIVIERTFSDHAKSGASVENRCQIAEMNVYVEENQIDVVIVEDAERLARNLGDAAIIFAKLAFCDCRLASVKRGFLTEKDIAIFGIFSEHQRTMMVDLARRQMRERIKAGLWSGRAPYGYEYDPKQKGILRIVPSEAEAIQFAFEKYDSGLNLSEIARALKSAGFISRGRGSNWMYSALSIRRSRPTGILHNPLCVGYLIYGTTKYVAVSGRRSYVHVVQEDNIVVFKRPELAVIDEDRYLRVQVRLEAERKQPSPRIHKDPESLLGKMFCSYCGSGMTQKGTRLRCGRDFRSSWGLCESRAQSVLIEPVFHAVEECVKARDDPSKVHSRRSDVADKFASIKKEIEEVKKEIQSIARRLMEKSSRLDDDRYDALQTRLSRLNSDLDRVSCQVEGERHDDSGDGTLALSVQPSTDGSPSWMKLVKKVHISSDPLGTTMKVEVTMTTSDSECITISREVANGDALRMEKRTYNPAPGPLSRPDDWTPEIEDQVWEAVRGALDPHRRLPPVRKEQMLGILYKMTVMCGWKEIPDRFSSPTNCRYIYKSLKWENNWTTVHKTFLEFLRERARSCTEGLE